MFDLKSHNVFALPPGCDFAKEFVSGFLSRINSEEPMNLARVEIFLSTSKLLKDVRNEFILHSNLLLPKLRILTDISSDLRFPDLPVPISSIQLRLGLMKAIDQLLSHDKRFASELTKYDLARSLQDLLQEFHQENINPERISTVDITNISQHWQSSLKFIKIISQFWLHDSFAVNETRQNLVIKKMVKEWSINPPSNPIIIAGSTGSIGSTRDLMEAISKLPQGMIVIPGYDRFLDSSVWEKLESTHTIADHPQYSISKIAAALQFAAADIPLWTTTNDRLDSRKKLISLALIPAPVTDQWMAKIGKLANIDNATQGISLLETPTARLEALAIALAMRKALEEHKTATLVTSDETLVKQVKLALLKWNIIPTDTRRGNRLFQSLEGRLLIMVANLMGKKATAEDIIALLKHPLVSSGSDHETHLQMVFAMEYFIRSRGIHFDPMTQIQYWGSRNKTSKSIKDWTKWVRQLLGDLEQTSKGTITYLITLHQMIAESLAVGFEGVPKDNVFDEQNQAYKECKFLFEELRKSTDDQFRIEPSEYAELFTNLTSDIRIGSEEASHHSLQIMSTEDARMHVADLVIAGGLNEGSWPHLQQKDPWLNRSLRHQLGLQSPELKIGLNCHDFQHVSCLPNIILSRSIRDSDTPTNPSRWLSRLISLLQGAGQRGEDALKNMRRRGEKILGFAQQFETTKKIKPYSRPCPCPPHSVRPKELSVTQIRTLITDPYAIYAKKVLNLQKISNLRLEQSQMLKGTLFHEILEKVVSQQAQLNKMVTKEDLTKLTKSRIRGSGAQPFVEAIWIAHIQDNAESILTMLNQLYKVSKPESIEKSWQYFFPDLGFTLTAKPDRLDHGLEPQGDWHLFDYKSGNIPSRSVIQNYEKQMPLQTIMAEKGAFSHGKEIHVIETSYIGIGREIKIEKVERYNKGEDLFAADWTKFQTLIENYQDESFGYIPRRLGGKGMVSNDYDHLARFGEWLDNDYPETIKVTDE